jgi:hypothetical protein
MPGAGRTLLFLALALLAETAGTIGGFGSSVFFVPLANFFLPLTTVLGLVALFHLASNLAKLGLFRHGIDRVLLVRLGIPAVLAVALGALASGMLDAVWLEVVLAVFLVGSSATFLLRPGWSVAPTSRNAAIGGALSGLMAGMVGTGGAIRGVTMAAFALRKDVFVATSAAIDMGVDATRAVVYWRHGYMDGLPLAWIPPLVLVAVTGTWLGRAALRHIPQSRFRQIALGLVLLIGMVTLVKAVAAPAGG